MKKAAVILLFLCCLRLTLYSQLTFTVTNPGGNYSITCGNTTVNLFATSNYTASAVSYIWTNPQTGSIVTNSLGITNPGNYTVTANVGSLSVTQTLAVGVNTTAPGISILSTTNILSCAVPTLQLTGSSTVSNVNYLWSYAGGTATSSAGSLIVSANFSLAPTNTLLGNYSLTVTNPVNQCQSNTVISVYQNVFPPIAHISIGNPSVISCFSPTVFLYNTSSTGIPTSFFPNNMLVKAVGWIPPGPQCPSPLPPIVTNTFIAKAGTYKLFVEDLNNGCISMATVTVSGDMNSPAIVATTPFTVNCPNGTVEISPAIVGSTNNIKFQWTSPNGAITSGSNTPTLTTNSQGIYSIVATNTLNGCITTVTLAIYGCVGIDEPGNFAQLCKVYPNPVKDILHVTFETNNIVDLGLRIQNSLGQTVYAVDKMQPVMELDLRFLPAGIYYLCAQSANSQKVVKILKE